MGFFRHERGSPLDAASADDTVARALDAKGNPVLREIRAKGMAEGKAEGLAETVLTVLTGRDLSLDETIVRRILGSTDPTTLMTWLVKAASVTSPERIFEDRVGPTAKFEARENARTGPTYGTLEVPSRPVESTCTTEARENDSRWRLRPGGIKRKRLRLDRSAPRHPEAIATLTHPNARPGRPRPRSG